MGAEDVLVGADGRIWTATEDGSVLALDPGGGRVERVGRTEGRPLGLEQLPDGRILVCDAYRGLLALDPATGALETLATEAGGRPLLVCNNAAVQQDGTIWFSDSSAVHDLADWRMDLAEDTRSGRLLRRDPDGSVEVVLEGLRFANGVALAADESFVCVAESTGRTVVRRWLSGERAGRTDHLVRDLPGYPDNIALGTDGLVWVTIGSPTLRVLEGVLRSPTAVRKAVARMPRRLQPAPPQVAWVQAYDAAGVLVHDARFDDAGFHMATGVREHDGQVWLGSLEHAAVAWFRL
jgi:sugar lactone lactonase YvrE